MEKARWQASAFVIGAVLLLAGGADWVHDIMFYPWARATPPLLDEWVGELTTGSGEQLTVVFMLERARTDDGSVCSNCAQIEGSAVTCDAHGNVLRYRVSGSPLDRAGRQLRLGVIPRQNPPPDGLEFSAVSGAWDGADALTLQAEFFWRRGRSAISSTDDPATLPVPLRMWKKRSTATSPCVP
jgi:hypothetical protein